MQIPPELGQATSLTSLKLNSEALTGSIPTQIGELAALVQLEIYDNPGLSGAMPSEIGDLSQLTQVRPIRKRHLRGADTTTKTPRQDRCTGVALQEAVGRWPF